MVVGVPLIMAAQDGARCAIKAATGDSEDAFLPYFMFSRVFSTPSARLVGRCFSQA